MQEHRDAQLERARDMLKGISLYGHKGTDAAPEKAGVVPRPAVN